MLSIFNPMLTAHQIMHKSSVNSEAPVHTIWILHRNNLNGRISFLKKSFTNQKTSKKMK